jgi:hypothetical protein
MLEPEIEEFLACLSPDSMYEECISEDLHSMVMEDIEQGSLGNQDYIESWFKTFIEPQHSILQQFLALNPCEQLASHILVFH